MRYECLTCNFKSHTRRTMELHSDAQGHGDAYDYDLDTTTTIGSWDAFRVDHPYEYRLA